MSAYSDEKKLARRQTFVFSATLTMAHGGPRRIMKKKKVKFTPEQKLGEFVLVNTINLLFDYSVYIQNKYFS